MKSMKMPTMAPNFSHGTQDVAACERSPWSLMSVTRSWNCCEYYFCIFFKEIFNIWNYLMLTLMCTLNLERSHGKKKKKKHCDDNIMYNHVSTC